MMRKALCTFVLAMVLGVPPADAGPGGKGLLKRLLRRETGQVLKRDLLRDRRLPVRVLEKPRTVFRYTTREQAQREVRRGLRPGTHVTARGGPGRPLAPAAAQSRYGLPRTPEVRETVCLPEGTRIRQGKVIGGRPGYGEIVVAEPLAGKHVRRVVPLNKGKPPQ